ncbi:unnamed protein product, partial [Prorocentrum cordatum]
YANRRPPRTAFSEQDDAKPEKGAAEERQKDEEAEADAEATSADRPHHVLRAGKRDSRGVEARGEVQRAGEGGRRGIPGVGQRGDAGAPGARSPRRHRDRAADPGRRAQAGGRARNRRRGDALAAGAADTGGRPSPALRRRACSAQDAGALPADVLPVSSRCRCPADASPGQADCRSMSPPLFGAPSLLLFSSSFSSSFSVPSRMAIIAPSLPPNRRASGFIRSSSRG